MRIALDTVGGKYAPEAVVEGAALASRRWDNLEFCLVGESKALAALLNRYDVDFSRFVFLEGPVLVADAESPVAALKAKPNASILRALEAHQQGEVDAVVSAGSTGAQIVATIESLGLLEGVKRPAIGSYFPTQNGRTFLIDVGANASCRPIHLLQFAVMGVIFRQYLEGLQNPRVALISNGEESTKGGYVTREAHELMSIVPDLNFIGNIEGNDLYSGRADVVVCDGFTGNVLLKFAESIPQIVRSYAQGLQKECENGPAALEALIRTFDYQEFGGVPLLGVNGVSVICHGHSTPKAIANAIGEAIKMVNMRVNQHIKDQLSAMGQWSATVKTRALIGRLRRRSAGDKS
jgi:glycerol-3-phosphate acyltransferase PlsX